MSDVFISYSRKDKEFVQQLHQALIAQNRDVWIDWEDIPATADWWNEIKEGMDGANNVIFIISPDSAESKVCQDELDYAISSNKRLIPILYKTVPNNQNLHPRVTSHNWLIFENADFNGAFKALIKALDTDLPHVRAHTRILTKAREWDEHKQNPSYLLAGVDIDEAENWLAKAGDKEPFPTTLQAEYILASRKAQRARQQQLLIGVSIALVVSIALAILSLFLFNDASFNRDRIATLYVIAVTDEAEAVSLYQTAVAREIFIPRVSIVPDSPINIYSAPDPNSEVLDQLETTTEVILFGITSDQEFFFVEANGVEGWMWTRDLANNSRSTISVQPNIADFDPATGRTTFSRP
jgi:hypothetical protein